MEQPKLPIVVPTSARDVVINLGRSLLWSAYIIQELKAENGDTSDLAGYQPIGPRRG